MFAHPIRLLREAWRDPWALAQELYVMSTSREPRTVPAPVTIEVGPGQTALRLVRTTETSPSTSASVTRITQQAGPAASPDRASRIAREAERTRAPSPWELPEPIRPVTTDNGPAASTTSAAPGYRPATRTDRETPRSSADTTEAADLGPTRRAEEYRGRDYPDRPARPTSTPAAPSRPATIGGRAISPPTPRQDSRSAYRDPLFEVSGEVKFSGSQPVQFDTAPVIYNPITASYDSLKWKVPETHIPDARTVSGGGGLLGKVEEDGSSGSWSVTLYPNGPNSDQDTKVVDVKILNMDPSEKAPVGQWIEGIFSFDGDDGTSYCYCPDLWLE